jgi:hypothetical protein
VALFADVVDAPDARSFLTVVGGSLLPALQGAYEAYLVSSDEIADGPTHRFLRAARADKGKQAAALVGAAPHEPGGDGGARWQQGIEARLHALGGVPLGPLPETGTPLRIEKVPHTIPNVPARDPRYLLGRFYWPDNFDPAFPYGEGIRLQLRTAVSHLNEVWAVETAGAILFDLGPQLGWEFVMDAARWLYDESRHMTMGCLRLEGWGFEPSELPLGTFIYGSCAGRSATYRLAMLSFFETKNIGKKAQRAVSFGELGDRSGQRDMEFDWADEAIHAGYGRRWLKPALSLEGRADNEWPALMQECEQLVIDHIEQASEDEKSAIRRQAVKLIDKAEHELSSRIGGT